MFGLFGFEDGTANGLSIERQQAMSIRPFHILLAAAQEPRDSGLRHAGRVGYLGLSKSCREQLRDDVFPVHAVLSADRYILSIGKPNLFHIRIPI